MKCKRCNHEVLEGMNYCGHCGLYLHESRECDNCGEIIPAKYNFCYKCGQKLNPNFELIVSNITDDYIEEERVQRRISHPQTQQRHIRTTPDQIKFKNGLLNFSLIKSITIIICSFLLILCLFAPITKLSASEIESVSKGFFDANIFDYFDTLFKGIGKLNLENIEFMDDDKINYLHYFILDDFNNEFLFQRTGLYLGIFISIALLFIPIVCIIITGYNLSMRRENGNVYSILFSITLLLCLALFVVAPLYDVKPSTGLVLYFILNLIIVGLDIFQYLYFRIIKLAKIRVGANAIYAGLLIILFFIVLGNAITFDDFGDRIKLKYNVFYQTITYLDDDDIPSLLPIYKETPFLEIITGKELCTTNIWIGYFGFAISIITIVIGILIIYSIYQTIYNILKNREKNTSTAIYIFILILLIGRIVVANIFTHYFNEFLEVYAYKNIKLIYGAGDYITLFFAIGIFVYKIIYQQKIKNI